MADFYNMSLERDALGITGPSYGRDRDEESLPLEFQRAEGPYFHAQERVWRVWFGGADRFETFALEDFDAANTLFKRLKDERD